MTIPAFISALFGVTEPAIYGITLPMRTPFIMTCVAGAIQGAFLGFFNTTAYTMGGMGLFAIHHTSPQNMFLQEQTQM